MPPDREPVSGQNEELYRVVLDSIPDIVWTATPEGAQNWANLRWFEFNGIERGPTPPEVWRGIIHPDDVERTAQTWYHSLRTGEPYSCLHRNRRFDGEYRWVLTRAIPQRGADGRIVRWIGSGTDITELRRAEEALRGAIRARDEFVSVASHELKTPLTSLKLQAQVLRKAALSSGVRQVGPVELPGALDRVVAQVDKLNGLVENLLDLTRMGVGKLTIDRQQNDLSRTVSELAGNFLEQFTEAGMPLELSIEPGLQGCFDRFRIEQALANLLTNALKYGRSNGAVELTLRSSGTTAAEISVRDHGPGIPKADQQRIFERFERAVPGNRISGFGLGLFIVKEILEMHGGTVRLESEPGKGADFIVVLPLGGTP